VAVQDPYVLFKVFLGNPDIIVRIDNPVKGGVRQKFNIGYFGEAWDQVVNTIPFPHRGGMKGNIKNKSARTRKIIYLIQMMDAWSNIEISPDDPEIIAIDELEKALGDLPLHIRNIRELITRFEMCHFKYQQHCRYLKESNACLYPVKNCSRIGTNHISNGEKAPRRETTGRSTAGQRYIKALNKWLEVVDQPGKVNHGRG